MRAVALAIILFMLGCSGADDTLRDPTSLGGDIPLKPSQDDCAQGGVRANVFGSWYLDFQSKTGRYRHIYIFQHNAVRFIKICENGVRAVVDADVTITDFDLRFTENAMNIGQSGTKECIAEVSKKIWDYTINGSCLEVRDPAGNEELTFRGQ